MLQTIFGICKYDYLKIWMLFSVQLLNCFRKAPSKFLKNCVKALFKVNKYNKICLNFIQNYCNIIQLQYAIQCSQVNAPITIVSLSFK